MMRLVTTLFALVCCASLPSATVAQTSHPTQTARTTQRVAPPSKGLPGVKRSEKSEHVSSTSPSLRMFRMRNVMASWYCLTPVDDPNEQKMRDRSTPCVNTFGAGGTSGPVRSSIDDFKRMYSQFCRDATSYRHHGVICNDELMRKTYGAKVPM